LLTELIFTGRSKCILNTYKIVKIGVTTFSYVTKGTIFPNFLQKSNVLLFNETKKESLY